MFTKLPFVGPRVARDWWEAGYRSLDDVREALHRGDSRHFTAGLPLFGRDFNDGFTFFYLPHCRRHDPHGLLVRRGARAEERWRPFMVLPTPTPTALYRTVTPNPATGRLTAWSTGRSSPLGRRWKKQRESSGS